MMKFCPYCGTELLSEEAVFCMGCGNKLPHGNARKQENGNENNKKPRRGSEGNRNEKTGQLKRNYPGNSVDRKREIERMPRQYETDDVAEMYAKEQVTDVRYNESGYTDYEESKRYNPPVRKRRKPHDDYDGYYDDVVPYDTGRVREDNILDTIKKVFIIIIAALFIVAVCVVMMYIL